MQYSFFPERRIVMIERRSRRIYTAAVFGLLFLLLTTGHPLAAQEKLPEIAFEKYELPNGLDVILHVDHSIPMITVNVWYHVGSKNEKKGRTGFAHLFEHLMFEGSEHIPNYDEPMEKIGGFSNGSTSFDRTNYWENLPSNYLEMGLWLEADRLGYLLPVMDQEKLDTQRGVVQNEKRQGVDNQPYGRAQEILLKMLYPGDHPYSWSVIGSLEDLSAASLEDVKDFFKSYYTPNNASLCVAGDFDPEVAKKLIEKHFASIPPGPPIERLKKWIPELQGVKRTSTTDKIELPRVYMAWHSPALYEPGDAEFDLLSDILSSGKTSRLYQALVYEQEIAQDVSTYQASRELASSFHITVTAREGIALQRLEKAIDSELKKILEEGVSARELEQVQVNWEADFVRSLEKVGGFGGKADILNGYNVYLGDPDKLQWDLDRYARVEPVDIQRCAQKYLDMNKRVIVHFLPQGDLTSVVDMLDRVPEPPPLPEPGFTAPTIQTATLSNGAQLLLVEDYSLPLLQVNLSLKNGWAADPGDRPGAAALTADLLDEGTKTKTALEIAEEVRSLGAYFSTSSTFDSSDISLNILKSKLDPGLTLMSDVVQNPTFPEEELQRKKKLYLGRIQQEARQPLYVGLKLFFRKLYGDEHPYAQPLTGSGTPESVQALSRDDLVSFYKTNYSPGNAGFIVVGDISLQEAKAKLEKAFGAWRGQEAAPAPIEEPTPLASTQIFLVDKPGAAQSILVVGNLGLKRSHPDYTACEVVNNALGGMFTSRLNSNLREDKAYTYGVGSFFMGVRGTGPFVCYTQVQTEFTKESIHEIVKELRGIAGDNPLAGTELKASKDNLIKSYPQNFETFGGTAGQLDEIFTYALSQDQWKNYVAEVQAVDDSTALRVAKKYIRPEALLIVVVGDREKIESKIQELNLGSLHVIEEDE
jgi:zinc protease